MFGIQNVFRTSLEQLKGERILDLISARRHTPYLTRHRLAAIVARVRIVALSFSLLTVLWIAIDAATLSTEHWEILATCRTLGAVVFLLLATTPDWERDRVRTLTMLAITLAVPLAIYAVSQFLLAGTPSQGFGAINNDLYRALPLIVLAGLSIFPLVSAEGLLFGVAIASAVATIQIALPGENSVALTSIVWTLALTMGIYLLACAIQLDYMMVLLGRASHDPLTGALSRRSGIEAADLLFKVAHRQDAPLSILFLDVDDFKAINDAFGHHAGDLALKEITAKLNSVIRMGDVVIRWGGEEFIVLLPNTPMSGAAHVINRIMENWLGSRPDGAPITASIGLAERQADGVPDWSQLIALADKRMYVAKASGKATCVSQDEVPCANAQGLLRMPHCGVSSPD